MEGVDPLKVPMEDQWSVLLGLEESWDVIQVDITSVVDPQGQYLGGQEK